MADLKKFLDQQGVSTLWTKIAEKVATDVAAEASARQAAITKEVNDRNAAIKSASDALDLKITDVAGNLANLDTYVGDIPISYTESNIVAFIQKRAEEVLSTASGDSSSVLEALNTYKSENDSKVQANTDAIDVIEADYLKAADKTALANDIKANADEIIRIDNALKAAIENEGEGLDSIKELATWIETHGVEAAGYAAAIDALEGLVGNKAVATQIADAIAAENLSQYATDDDLAALAAKVDTGDKTVTGAINAAIAALKIGDYAKAADLAALATRVSTAEGKISDLEAADIAIKSRLDTIEAKVPTWDAAEDNAKAYADSLANNYDAKGAAATAESNAKAYADGLAVNYDAAGAAAKALTDAKAYTDSEINTKVIALTSAEIEAAIASATV